jgi:membrane-associated HD superfamily phosphohydrolase
MTFVRRSSGAGSAPSFVKQGRDQIRFVRACTCLRFTCRLVFALHVSGLLTPLCCNPDLMIVELSESSNYFILSVVLLVEEYLFRTSDTLATKHASRQR